MKNNKLSGLIIGGVLGFVFIITCTSPVESNTSETSATSSNGKYQIAITNIKGSASSEYLIETIINSETGEIVSRTIGGIGDYEEIAFNE